MRLARPLPLLAAPLPLRLRDAGADHAVRFFSPTHPHLYVLVECMCQAPPGLGGVVLPLGSLGPYTGSREPSRVRPRLLDPTPLRRAVRRDWHVTSRKRRDMPIPSILPTVSRVEASKKGFKVAIHTPRLFPIGLPKPLRCLDRSILDVIRALGSEMRPSMPRTACTSSKSAVSAIFGASCLRPHAPVERAQGLRRCGGGMYRRFPSR